MIQWIVSSCALICIVLVLRWTLKQRISARLRYALWGLVLLRLLLPLSFGHSAVSVMNAVPLQARSAEQTDRAAAPVRGQISPLIQFDPALYTAEYTPADDSPTQRPSTQTQTLPAPSAAPSDQRPTPARLSPVQLLGLLWFAGGAVTALLLFGSSLRFTLRLRRSRRRLALRASLPVYVSAALDSPCLVGVFRPCIYLTPEAAEDETVRRHTLVHETSHFRQLDHIWAPLYCAALALHWYNPLVWLAAGLARRDRELACDELTLRRLGDRERAAYGNTLLDLTVADRRPGAALSVAAIATMAGGKACITERIRSIARSRKMLRRTAMAVLLTAAIAVGCTFTGASAAVLASAPQDDEAELRLRSVLTPYNAEHLAAATLHWNGQEFPVTDEADLELLRTTLSAYASELYKPSELWDPGCSLSAELAVTMDDGTQGQVWLTTDHCCSWQSGYRYYKIYCRKNNYFQSFYMRLAINAAARGQGANPDGWLMDWDNMESSYGAEEASALLDTLTAWATSDCADALEAQQHYVGLLRCASGLSGERAGRYGQALLTLYERDPQYFAICSRTHLGVTLYASMLQLLADAAGETYESLDASMRVLAGG